MRRSLVVAFVLLGFAPTFSQDAPDRFFAVLPKGVDDISGWETVSGEFQTPQARGAYRFHVNPRRQALYQVMRYRLELLAPSNRLERERGSSERFAYVHRPGTAEPIRCWELRGPGTEPRWRELQAGTPQYQLEMAVLMQVLAVHRAARLSGGP
jgi:hypothetical protein